MYCWRERQKKESSMGVTFCPDHVKMEIGVNLTGGIMLHERVKWSLVGVLLGLGSPAGWLIIRYFLTSNPGDFSDWAIYEIGEQNVLYLYETLGTVLSFGIFGYVAGTLLEKVRHKTRLLEAKTQDYMKIVEFVAHELRTPLTSVKGRIDLALNDVYGPLSEKLNEALQKAVRGCDQINQMIAAYLNLARIERGELMVKKTRIDMFTDIFTPLSDELKGHFESQSMTLQFEDLGNQKPLVWGDSQWLKVAFRNLLVNAVRYGYHDTAVKVTLKNEGWNWIFEIYNEGCGIPADYLERIFMKFQKAPREDKMAELGTGLGLYIVREIIHQHQGKIWCESKINHWTKMTVLLPKFFEKTEERKHD
jgi:signal transduction histidine kinase